MSVPRQTSASAPGSRAFLGSASPACRLWMMVPSSPDASSPGPRGPDELLADGRKPLQGGLHGRGHVARAASGSPDRRRLVGRGPLDQRPWRRRPRRPRRGLPYGRQPWPGPRLGRRPLRREPSHHEQRRHRRTAGGSRRRRRARHERRLVSGRWRPGGAGRSGACASNNASTRSAQAAAHAATIRRSLSLSVCGEPMACIVARAQMRKARAGEWLFIDPS